MTTGPFAFVRSLKTSSGSNIKEFAQIQSAEQHAKRGDAVAKRRQVEGRSHEANYFWSKAGKGLDGGGVDYAAAFRAHKIEAGVKTERKGAALAEHLLVGVSPEWLQLDGGDSRDLANPRVVQLIEEARAWAESWMGDGAVWAVRYDTDEKGSGIVDVLASPIRQNRHKSGSSKPAISVRKAGVELAEKHGAANAWIAMQTDWALWTQDRMDPALQRGIPRKETERAHVAPETYAAQVEAAVAEARAAVDIERDALARDRDVLAAREAEIVGVEATTAARIAEADSRVVAAADIEDRAKAARLAAKQDSDRVTEATEAARDMLKSVQSEVATVRADADREAKQRRREVLEATREAQEAAEHEAAALRASLVEVHAEAQEARQEAEMLREEVTQLNTQKSTLEAALEHLRPAAEAMKVWTRRMLDQQFLRRTPTERSAAARAKYRQAQIDRQNGKCGDVEVEAVLYEVQQCVAEAWPIIRVERLDVARETAWGRDIRTGEEHVARLCDSDEYVTAFHQNDVYNTTQEGRFRVAGEKLEQARVSLAKFEVGTVAAMIGYTHSRVKNGIHLIRRFVTCDPPRPDPSIRYLGAADPFLTFGRDEGAAVIEALDRKPAPRSPPSFDGPSGPGM